MRLRKTVRALPVLALAPASVPPCLSTTLPQQVDCWTIHCQGFLSFLCHRDCVHLSECGWDLSVPLSSSSDRSLMRFSPTCPSDQRNSSQPALQISGTVPNLPFRSAEQFPTCPVDQRNSSQPALQISGTVPNLPCRSAEQFPTCPADQRDGSRGSPTIMVDQSASGWSLQASIVTTRTRMPPSPPRPPPSPPTHGAASPCRAP